MAEWTKLQPEIKVLVVVGIIALLLGLSWVMAQVPQEWAFWRWYWEGHDW